MKMLLLYAASALLAGSPFFLLILWLQPIEGTYTIDHDGMTYRGEARVGECRMFFYGEDVGPCVFCGSVDHQPCGACVSFDGTYFEKECLTGSAKLDKVRP